MRTIYVDAATVASLTIVGASLPHGSFEHMATLVVLALWSVALSWDIYKHIYQPPYN